MLALAGVRQPGQWTVGLVGILGVEAGVGIDDVADQPMPHHVDTAQVSERDVVDAVQDRLHDSQPTALPAGDARSGQRR